MSSPEAARAWLEVVQDLVVSARNQADRGGDGAALARTLEDTSRRIPAAGSLNDPGALAELQARAPELADRVATVLRWPWAEEARLRVALAPSQAPFAGAPRSLQNLLRDQRSSDAQRRAASSLAIEQALEDLAPALLALGRRAVKVPPPVAPPAPTLSTVSGLLVPNAMMVEQIALGVFDPSVLRPAPVAPAPEAAPKEEVTDRPSIGPWLRALTESVLGRAPVDHAELTCAAAGVEVADFSPTPWALFAELSPPELPHDLPGVPWARGRAGVHPGKEADRTLAHGLAAGALLGGWALGGAIAFTMVSEAFVRLGLRDSAGDRLRAVRAMAVALTRAIFHHDVGAMGGDPAALRRRWSREVGVAVPENQAMMGCAEALLAHAPGEERALYPRGGAAFSEAMARGLPAAQLLRDRFDEDWWRNPRATRERIVELIAHIPVAAPGDGMAWIRAATRL